MTSSSGAFTINPELKHKHKISSSMQHSASPKISLCHCISSWITFTQRLKCKNVRKQLKWCKCYEFESHPCISLTFDPDMPCESEGPLGCNNFRCAKRTAAWSVMALLERAKRWLHRAFIPTPTRVFIIFSCLCTWKPPQSSSHWISDAPVWTNHFHYVWFHFNGSLPI